MIVLFYQQEDAADRLKRRVVPDHQRGLFAVPAPGRVLDARLELVVGARESFF
jgi:hypothetical protein